MVPTEATDFLTKAYIEKGKGISCHLATQTEPEYISLGIFKKSNKILKTRLSEDYQDMVQELSRVNREYRQLIHGFDKKISKSLRSGAELDLLEDERIQERQNGLNSQRSILGDRRVRSQSMRRDKLKMQGERNHRAHSIESGRRRRLQPDDDDDS